MSSRSMAPDDRGLDYASPSTPDPSLPHHQRLTPEELRFRRRLKIVVGALILLALIPYPTQVCPPITLQIVDDKSKPVLDVVSVGWDGYCNADSLRGYVQFDLAARAALSRQWVWASPLKRFVSLIPFPHGGGGWFSPRARLTFLIPAEYDLDGAAMGLTATSWPRAGSSWIDPKTGTEFGCFRDSLSGTRSCSITMSAGWLASPPTTLKIILRRTTPAANRN